MKRVIHDRHKDIEEPILKGIKITGYNKKKLLEKFINILIIILSIFILLVGYILLAYNTHKWFKIEIIGQTGDSFGGLVSPIIGIVTIYFVLKSYNKQRDTHDLDLKTTYYATINEAIKELDNLTNEKFIDQIIVKLTNLYLVGDLISDGQGGYTQDTPNNESIVLNYYEESEELKKLINILFFFNTILHTTTSYPILDIHYSILSEKAERIKENLKLNKISEIISQNDYIQYNDLDLNKMRKMFLGKFASINDKHLYEKYEYYYLHIPQTIRSINANIGDLNLKKLVNNLKQI